MNKANDLWQVYLLECCDGSFYCGITNDLSRRLLEHNGLRRGGARYTRTRRPNVMRACLPCYNRPTAAKLEAKVKKLPKKQKLAFFWELR